MVRTGADCACLILTRLCSSMSVPLQCRGCSGGSRNGVSDGGLAAVPPAASCGAQLGMEEFSRTPLTKEMDRGAH
ncbi:hypothetical protein C2845_PM15G08590 [Panicum miliaceum]|uniref:Uncharacterized protein n=1 Tax=Panicum miliaceum TaxID=4540 RepID=A0A3L6Q7A0_PANMI|nr:hypothetical protein C2845_PM15G08590 [Panicum miliaceum]